MSKHRQLTQLDLDLQSLASCWVPTPECPFKKKKKATVLTETSNTSRGTPTFDVSFWQCRCAHIQYACTLEVAGLSQAIWDNLSLFCGPGRPHMVLWNGASFNVHMYRHMCLLVVDRTFYLELPGMSFLSFLAYESGNQRYGLMQPH